MAYNNGFPMATTAGAGLFNGPSSKGYIVGQAQPDPATRYALKGGIIASDETLPMFGGVGVYADVPLQSLSVPLPAIGRASAITGGSKNLIGFAVSDQSYNLVINPQNPVPAGGPNQTIGWYTLGSRARIAVACDPALIDLAGGLLNQQVSWDFVEQRLVPYAPAYAIGPISNAVWASTGGGQITFTTTTDYSALLTAGDNINVSGVVNTGGASTSAFDGPWTVKATPGATTVVVNAPASGSIGTYASGGNILPGGGALPVTVLDVLPTGNMVPVYNSTTGQLSWNYSGSAALIQLTGGTVA